LACKTERIDAWVLPRAVPPRPGPGDLAAHPRGCVPPGSGPGSGCTWSATGPR
jgi:hypothetical protein